MTNSQDILQLIMIGILLLCGYIFLFQLVARKTENKASVPIIAVILLFIYLLVAIPLVLIIGRMGSTAMMLQSLLILFACLALFAAVLGMIRNFRELNKGMLALFITYVLALGYITIFSRDETNDTSIFLFRMDVIREAIRTRSFEPLQHILLNIAMFIPLGLLFCAIYPEKTMKFGYAAALGMICTTIIETTQMLLKLGQADLMDILTNVLGAIIGYLIFRLFHRFRREEEYEDE